MTAAIATISRPRGDARRPNRLRNAPRARESVAQPIPVRVMTLAELHAREVYQKWSEGKAAGIVNVKRLEDSTRENVERLAAFLGVRLSELCLDCVDGKPCADCRRLAAVRIAGAIDRARMLGRLR